MFKEGHERRTSCKGEEILAVGVIVPSACAETLVVVDCHIAGTRSSDGTTGAAITRDSWRRWCRRLCCWSGRRRRWRRSLLLLLLLLLLNGRGGLTTTTTTTILESVHLILMGKVGTLLCVVCVDLLLVDGFLFGVFCGLDFLRTGSSRRCWCGIHGCVLLDGCRIVLRGRMLLLLGCW